MWQVSTTFQLQLDADVLPNPGLKEPLSGLLSAFGAFLAGVALVLPAFEVPDGDCALASSALPVSKPEVIGAVRAGQARPFYHAVNQRVQVR